jgi:hypothetical protein
MFFRGRQPESTIWRRFRSATDGFSFKREEAYYSARVIANAERVVDLFHALTEQMPPAVDLAIDDWRNDAAWSGKDVALPDVRDVIARLKVPLSTYGGVELAVYTAEDQLTLTPQLELYIYARTDQWYYVLRGKGLEEQPTVRPRSWRLTSTELAPAPELGTALEQAVERLALVRT